VQAFGALGLSGLTALSFNDRRLSDEQLSQLLAPLTQLQEMTLRNYTVRSAAFLQAGSLPRTLRSLHLAADIPAAELEDALPALGSLTELVLLPWQIGGQALEPLAAQLRVPPMMLR